jgi:conjugative transfer region protein (TIGR03750 family)
METPDLLPNRLNFDAIVFCGCTMKEMQVIAISCISLCVVTLGFLTKLLFNMFLIGVGLAFPIGVGVTWSVAMLFQRAKQGKPKGYIKQWLLLWCEDKRLLPAIYLRRSGKWSVGRFIQ